ncbi:MAG TPA: VWA domain-containing protein, partial [Thermoanaerobaculia bacterium]|nr:VWA domain-containing protein [Thermoanaerobaculia bacterium]
MNKLMSKSGALHRRRYNAGIAAGLAVAGLGLLPLPGAAQQTFTESTQVLAVEVPVQVVKDGEPVRGLTANDFELYDGRKKVPISGFEVLDLATAPAEAAPGAPPPPPVPVSARRHFLLLFDLSFSEPKSILKARQAAQTVVDTMHPTDLVAVATYSIQQGPQLVIGFTPDRHQIAAAIDTLGAPKLIDRSPDPLKLVLSQAYANLNGSTGTAGGVGRASAQVNAGKDAALLETLNSIATSSNHAERTEQTNQVLGLTRSFADLARLMAEVEGRKYVVYLSEGYDSSLVSGKAITGPQSAENADPAVLDIGNGDRIRANTDATGNDDRFGNTRAQNAVEKMLEAFRRADCAIQAVDIGGLRAGNDQNPQHALGREALFNMAKSTGGELFENYNDLSVAMGQMLRRTAVTYVLSFQPADVKSD